VSAHTLAHKQPRSTPTPDGPQAAPGYVPKSTVVNSESWRYGEGKVNRGSSCFGTYLGSLVLG